MNKSQLRESAKQFVNDNLNIQPGDTVEVVVYRNNRQITVNLTLGEYVP